jgi:excisionase family DNA binding protein
MMTLTEVAEYSNVHKITIYRQIKAEVQLGQFKVGRILRFSREHIERFANEGAGTSFRPVRLD